MILVTGGTGLLGSHLLFKLASYGTKVKALYRNSARIERVKKLFQFYNPENGAELFENVIWVEGDILDIASLEEAMQDCRFVYHCAGMVSFHRKDYFQLMKINREGTANVVNVALSLSVKKLCHVSSTAAIGGEADTLLNETTPWKQNPLTSGYAISKYSAEKEVWRGVEEGLDAVIVNPSVIFGAGHWDESSLTIFRTVSKGLKYYTSGKNAFVDARDVVEIMVKLMDSDIKNERFLCISKNVHFKVLIELIAKQLEKPLPHKAAPEWAMGIICKLAWVISKFRGEKPTITSESARTAFKSMEYDNSKVCNILSFKFRPLEETIQNTVQGKLD
jgi:nucleoside-diphosphate-sugar epimerase